MKTKLASIIAAVVLCAAILGAPSVPTAHADEWNKKTVITFPEDVQVPGTVLPAGTYVFKLADSQSDRTIVQIFNANETHLITTILAINDYRMGASTKPIVSFDERPSGQPEAIRAWFYPGEQYGVAFVYPRQRASELANANREPVLATPTLTVPTTTTETVAPIEPVQPAPTKTVENNDKPNVDANVPATDELPHTASPVPTIALGGFLMLVAAFLLRRFAAVTE